MARELGFRRSPAATISNDNLNPFGNGFFRVEFTPQIFAVATDYFVIYHIYLQGPDGSQFRMFINDRPYSTSSRGDTNEYDPNNVLVMIGGQSLNFFWNAIGTPAPLVYVSMRDYQPNIDPLPI